MLVGYSRVSTDDQNLNLQRDALLEAGCEKLFDDKVSGAKATRPGLQVAFSFIRPGDTLVVWRLDRLGRSLKDLIEWINNLEEKNVGFKSLQESIDTSSSAGKLIFHIFSALAEFERGLIRARTQTGLNVARARGRKGGRSKALGQEQQQKLLEMYENRLYPIQDICKIMGISKPTLYKYVNAREGN